MDPDIRQALLTEYTEVCQNFRLLTDIRFRLLAFVPAVAAIITVVKDVEHSPDMLPVALLGLMATLGIATYDKRNNQLYSALIERAAAIEKSLGLHEGSFSTRPPPWLRYRVLGVKWKVDHGNGVCTIYTATFIFWVYLVLGQVFDGIAATDVWRLALKCFSENLNPALASWLSIDSSSRVMAAATAVLLVCLCVRSLRRQKKPQTDDPQAAGASPEGRPQG